MLFSGSIRNIFISEIERFSEVNENGNPVEFINCNEENFLKNLFSEWEFVEDINKFLEDIEKKNSKPEKEKDISKSKKEDLEIEGKEEENFYLLILKSNTLEILKFSIL